MKLQDLAVKELKTNGFRFGGFLDMRHARVLNPRSSVAFGVQTALTHAMAPGMALSISCDSRCDFGDY